MTFEKIGNWTYGAGLMMLVLGVPWYYGLALMLVGITFWDLNDWDCRRTRKVNTRSP